MVAARRDQIAAASGAHPGRDSAAASFYARERRSRARRVPARSRHSKKSRATKTKYAALRQPRRLMHKKRHRTRENCWPPAEASRDGSSAAGSAVTERSAGAGSPRRNPAPGTQKRRKGQHRVNQRTPKGEEINALFNGSARGNRSDLNCLCDLCSVHKKVRQKQNCMRLIQCRLGRQPWTHSSCLGHFDSQRCVAS